MAYRTGGVRPMPRRRPPTQAYDATDLEPEMAETLKHESARRDTMKAIYSPISQGVQKAQQTFDIGGFVKGLFRGKKK